MAILHKVFAVIINIKKKEFSIYLPYLNQTLNQYITNNKNYRIMEICLTTLFLREHLNFAPTGRVRLLPDYISFTNPSSNANAGKIVYISLAIYILCS
jgi:hypothetical protein